ncbi:MAG TPA: alpha/beta fold hydrolase [Ktedonobacterales bacterium]|nr:alpha/beta fold hydrolase [Ktedonobacterales bacterium]
MADLYPEIEPYAHGWLDVGDGHRVYWETCGNPNGKPAVVVHGGPGSGCTPWHRRLFDPGAYRVVLFDQRNCGRSTPHASTPDIDLTTNTTAHLIADMEGLRDELDIDRWLVFGGSWGSILSLAYAEQYPQHVTELILFGVTTGRWSEFDWLFRGGVGIFFPEQWDRLRASLPPAEREGDVVAAYHRLLTDPVPAICQRAAEAWCLRPGVNVRSWAGTSAGRVRHPRGQKSSLQYVGSRKPSSWPFSQSAASVGIQWLTPARRS